MRPGVFPLLSALIMDPSAVSGAEVICIALWLIPYIPNSQSFM